MSTEPYERRRAAGTARWRRSTRSRWTSGRSGEGLAHGPRRARVPARSGYERVEQRPVVAQRLGVPLHADRQLAVAGLDRLHGAVGRPRDGPQPMAELRDGLVMERVDRPL